MSGHAQNPYPGLRPFRTDEDALFFGREEQTTDLLELLRTNRFLAVVGTSGSGKSSLVRAGLIPALFRGALDAGNARWEIAVQRPAGDPLRNLAVALCEAELYDAQDADSIPRVVATLRRSTRGLIEAFRQSDRAPNSRLLLVVDQFEELFRYSTNDSARGDTTRAFVDLLLEATRQTELSIYVAVTMRSDYLGECARIRGLAEAVNAGEYLVPRLSREQMRRAIEGPARVGGGAVTKRFVQRLLADLGDDSDQLPVLQHALMRAWDGRSGDEELDLQHYEATGGFAEALSRHADEVFAGLATDSARATAERVFKALTEMGPGGGGIRRPTRVTRLEAITRSDHSELEAVLDAYRARGVSFVMPGEAVSLDDDPVIDISHESLMRIWTRLRAWLEEEAQSARTYRRLAETAALWREGSAGLYGHPELEVAQSWREESRPNPSWASQYAPGYENAIAFLDASQEAAMAAQQAREEARQRELEQARELAVTQSRAATTFRRFAVGVAVLAVVALALAVQAFRLRGEAEENRKIAVQNEATAKTEALRALEAESDARHEQGSAWLEHARSLIDEKRFLAGKLLAARTLGFDGYGRNTLARTEPSLVRSLLKAESAETAAVRELIDTNPDYAPAFRSAVAAAPGETYAVTWSADGRQVATGNDDGVIEVWDSETGARLHAFQAHDRRVSFVALTPDGESVVSASRESATVRRHDLETSTEIWSLPHDSLFRTGALSPRGDIAVATDSSGAIVRIVVETGERLPALASRSTALGVAFHPSAPLLASGHADGDLRLWNVQTGELLQRTRAHPVSVFSVAFSPDGRRILTSSEPTGASPAGVKVWTLGEANTLTLEAEWSEFARTGFSPRRPLRLYWVEVRPQADFAVVSSNDGRLHLRNFPDGAPLGSLDGHCRGIRTFDIRPDGSRLASVASDGTVRLWDLATRRDLSPHGTGNVELAQGVDFSPDGRLLATASVDGIVRLRDLTSGEVVRRRRAGGNLGNLRFAPDGNRIAVVDTEVVRVLDVATLGEVAQLPARLVRSLDWSPSGERLATASFDAVRLWDTTRFEAVTQLATSASTLSFSPDSKALATSSRRGTALWSVETGRRISEWPEVGSASDIALHPDGQIIATGGSGGNVTFWTTTNPPVEVGSVKSPSSGSIRRIEFSPDGTLLAAAGRDETVRLWDVRTRRLLATLEGHSRALRELRFAPDGRSLATTSADNTVRLWEIDRSLENESLDVGEIDHRQVRFVDSETLVSLGSSGVHLIDRRRGTVLRSLSSRVFAGGHLTVSPDGRHVVAGGQRGAALLEIATGDELAHFENSSYVFTASAFSPDGHRVGVSRGTWLDLFDLTTHRKTSWPQPANIVSLGFDANSRLYGARDDGSVAVIDVERREEVGEFGASDSELHRLRITRDGATLATADLEGTVRLWSLPAQQLEHEIDFTASRRVEIEFAPDGERLATLVDGEVRLWSTTTGRELRRYANTGLAAGFAPHRMDFSPDGELIAADGQGSTIAMYEVDPPVREAARIAEYLGDFRLEGRRVRPREGNLLAARPEIWRPRLASTHLGLLAGGGTQQEIDRALVRHYVATGNLDSASVVLRRLPAAAQVEEAPGLVDALGRRVERLGRRRLTDLALRYADLALDLAPLAGEAAVFDTRRRRAEALLRGGRGDEALTLYASSIEAATSQGLPNAAEELAASRLRLDLERGELAAARNQLAALLALPGLADAERRAFALRRYLAVAGRTLLQRDTNDDAVTDALLGAALAEVLARSDTEAAIDLSGVETLASLVTEARKGREPVALVARDAEWRYWDAGRGTPPASWRERAFDDSDWPASSGPLDFGESAAVQDRRSESLVVYARTTFRLDSTSLPAGTGLSFRERCRPAAAFFLNGHEVLRRRLPPGDLGPDTAAPARVLGYPGAIEGAGLAEPLVDGDNVLAVQVHRTKPGLSSARVELEIVATVTPGSYLAAQAARMDRALDAAREFLPQSSLEELGPSVRFAFAASVPENTPLASQATAWLRRARTQRAIGAVDAALGAFERAVETARESATAASSDLAARAQQELDALRRASGRSGG